jgi:hypothetical protein
MPYFKVFSKRNALTGWSGTCKESYSGLKLPGRIGVGGQGFQNSEGAKALPVLPAVLPAEDIPRGVSLRLRREDAPSVALDVQDVSQGEVLGGVAGQTELAGRLRQRVTSVFHLEFMRAASLLLAFLSHERNYANEALRHKRASVSAVDVPVKQGKTGVQEYFTPLYK